MRSLPAGASRRPTAVRRCGSTPRASPSATRRSRCRTCCAATAQRAALASQLEIARRAYRILVDEPYGERARRIAIAILVEGSKRGWATTVPAKIDESVDAAMWEPAYRAYVPA